MKISVSFEELNALAAEHLKVGTLTFSAVDPRTLQLTFSKIVKVKADLKIERIEGNDVFVTYHAGPLAGKAISALLETAKGNPELAFVTVAPDSGLVVHLDRIDKARPVLERVALREIGILADAVEVRGEMR